MCSHICRSYCLQLSPEKRWSPGIWLCSLVSSIFLQLSCVCSSGTSQGQQEAGWKALSNRAEQKHCQCRMWPFPTENCCTDAMHELMHSILLKEWIWLWVWRWAILPTGICKKCGGSSAIRGNCIFLAKGSLQVQLGRELCIACLHVKWLMWLKSHLLLLLRNLTGTWLIYATMLCLTHKNHE